MICEGTAVVEPRSTIVLDASNAYTWSTPVDAAWSHVRPGDIFQSKDDGMMYPIRAITSGFSLVLASPWHGKRGKVGYAIHRKNPLEVPLPLPVSTIASAKISGAAIASAKIGDEQWEWTPWKPWPPPEPEPPEVVNEPDFTKPKRIRKLRLE